AFHPEVRPTPPPERLQEAPTLVICHKLYEDALYDLTIDDEVRYDKVMQFRGGHRKLVIVDEAIDQVYIGRIPRAGLGALLEAISGEIASQDEAAIDVLESVLH